MNSRSIARWLVPLCAVLVAAAGCGDDGSTSSAQEGDPAVELTGEPIKFSLMSPMSGAGYQPGRTEGAFAAAEAINAAGGIDGRPIEIITCDPGLTTTNPTGGVDCANAAIDAGVIASVGDTQGDANVLPLFAEADIAVIGQQPINGGDFSAENSFPLQPGGPITLGGHARALADAGATKIKLISLEVPQAELSQTFANQALEPLGLEIEELVLVPPDPSTDFAPYIANAIGGDTDGLIVAFTGESTVRVVKGARQAGFEGKIAVLPFTLDQRTISAMGDDGEGIVFAGSYLAPWADHPRAVQYRDEMFAYEEDAPISEYSQESWLAVHFVAERLATLPTIDAKTLLESLPGSTVDLHGMAPTFTFSPPPDGLAELPRIFQVLVQFQTIEDGKTVPMGDGEFVNPRAA